VIVNRDIDEPLIASSDNETMNELRCKGSVTDLSGHVVSTFLSEDDFAHVQGEFAFLRALPREQHGPVFISISREEMRKQLVVVRARNSNCATRFHGICSR